ncbi:MAG: hypothetical protein GXP48_03450 [Acidobacteria bacterium]|nr:hypothetical protein [Acidobacteriota bacterium]
MNSEQLSLVQSVRRHLLRMRVVTAVFLVTIPVAGAGAFFLPRQRLDFVSPQAVLAITALIAAWYAFTINRFAAKRLHRIREAFDSHEDVERLLSGHFRVSVTVLVRLEVIVVCGLINAEAGAGPHTTVWYVIAAGLLMLLAWPTEHKTMLLLRRVGAMNPRHPRQG